MIFSYLTYVSVYQVPGGPVPHNEVTAGGGGGNPEKIPCPLGIYCGGGELGGSKGDISNKSKDVIH